MYCQMVCNMKVGFAFGVQELVRNLICVNGVSFTFSGKFQGQLGNQFPTGCGNVSVVCQGYANRLYPLLFEVIASDIYEALERFLLAGKLNVAGQLIHFLLAFSAYNTMRSCCKCAQTPFDMPMKAHHPRLCPASSLRQRGVGTLTGDCGCNQAVGR